MPHRKKTEEPSEVSYATLDDSHISGTTQAMYDAGLAAGYAKGLEDAKPRPPLFDACKKVTEQYRGDERGWFSAISAVEDEYGETLAISDRDLLRGVHSRYRLVRESQRLSEITQSPVKPKTQLPAPDAPRGAPEYEVVA